MLIVNPHRIFTQVSSVCNFKNKQQETGGTKEIQKLQTFEASLHVSGHEKLHTHTHTHTHIRLRKRHSPVEAI